MKLLLDTRAVYGGSQILQSCPSAPGAVISDPNNTIFISAATGWELAIKVNLGKLDALPLVTEMPRHVREEGFLELPISIDHAVRAGLLPLHHRDPFDRLLVAQAEDLNLPILSADRILDRYDIKRLW